MGLFKPDWKTDDYDKLDKALRAVEKETNQKKLAEIAKTAPLYTVGLKAVEMLFDQTLLIGVAKYAKYIEVLLAAVEKLTDQTIIADVAKNVEDTRIRLKATEKLTDQTLAQEVFTEIAIKYKRAYIVEKIENLDDLKKVSETFSYCDSDINFNLGTLEKSVSLFTSMDTVTKKNNEETIITIVQRALPRSQSNWYEYVVDLLLKLVKCSPSVGRQLWPAITRWAKDAPSSHLDFRMHSSHKDYISHSSNDCGHDDHEDNQNGAGYHTDEQKADIKNQILSRFPAYIQES